MAYALPDLPYAYDALEPYISAKTLEFHHDKHHAKYVNNFNDMSQSSGMADKSIEEVIKASYNDSSKTGLFNNAAQAWNHTFFWNSMKSGGGGAPSGAVADKINSDLGGYDKFKEEFTKAATSQFGSGWAWLVLDKGTLKVVNTANSQLRIPDTARYAGAEHSADQLVGPGERDRFEEIVDTHGIHNS